MTKLPVIAPLHPLTRWPVWGQTAAISELINAVRTGPNHAYVFAGPENVGKRASAIAFARALCCPGVGVTNAGCGECSVCRRITRGVFPDVSVFDLKSQAERDRDKSKNLALNISTVREVSTAVAYLPSEARWRIVIVDDVESMQETAQEAFLKTLEEPPSYAVIILVTSDLENLLPTIRSRCVTVRFGLSGTEDVRTSLEASGVEDRQAERIAKAAQGSIGWAFEAANDATMVQAREEQFSEAMQFVTASGYDRMVSAVLIADEFTRDRESVYARLHVVQGIWRTALYTQQGMTVDTNQFPDTGWLDRVQELRLEDLVRSIRSVDSCIANLEANVRPRLALESMVIAWPRLPS